MPDLVHQRLAAVLADDVLHGIARADVVENRRAGTLHQERFGEQCRHEIPGDELAGAVDEEAAIGITIPGDADVGLLLHHALDDVAAILFDERVGLVVGEGAIHVEAERRQLLDGEPLEQPGRHESGHAAAAVEHDIERLDGLLVDEGHHVRDVVLQDFLAGQRSLRGGWRRQRAVADHVADLADAGVAAQWKRLAPDHLDPVVLLRIVRRRDLHAAVVAVPGDGEVHHVGRNHPVVDDVAPCSRAPSMKAAATDGDDRRMSRPTAMRFASR